MERGERTMRAIDADALKEDLTRFYDNEVTARKLIDEQPTIHPEPHWIPVTEDTLPERNRVVVVCGEKGTWDFGTYRGHGNDIHYWNWKKNTYKRVYWWMYKENALPEPYKGVTE